MPKTKKVVRKKAKSIETALTLPLLNSKGKEVDSVKLDSIVFDGKVNTGLMQQAVVVYLANQRKGLAHTKTRGEVSGGGRKPWRQKGTGRARVGSTRSPLWRTGGITFGPRPHSFHKDMPKRMRAAALKSALNAKLRDNEITVLDSLELTSHKTKEFFKILKNLKLDEVKTMLVLDTLDENTKLASRNIEKFRIGISKDLNTYDALNCKALVFTKNGLQDLQARILKWFA